MSKKNGFGKFILFCAAVFAAAAGIFLYLSNRDKSLLDSFDDDDFDEFDDFDDEDDESSEVKFGSRKYVDISSASSDEAEDKETASKDDQEPAGDKEPDSTKVFFDDEDK